LTVAQLRHGGVAQIKAWAKAHENWRGSLKTTFARVKAVFNFAANGDDNEDSLDLIQSSPIRKLNTGKNRVKDRTRITFFSQEHVDAILGHAENSTRCPQFGLAFKVLIGTGCRPEEFCGVTAKDVKYDEHGGMYWFVKHKNQKKTGERRRVYMLTAELAEITKEQMAKFPEGPLFRNGWGVAWNKGSLLTQLRRICESEACAALGLNEYRVVNEDAIAEAKRRKATVPKDRKEYKYVVYTTRHTFGYRWVNGFYGTE